MQFRARFCYNVTKDGGFMCTAMPSYYKDFKCIADKCTHNCCIGWEIDIDEDTANYYKNLGGEIGKRMRECIDFSETPHFILGEGDRCPFLNGDNLCDIIINCGKEHLCTMTDNTTTFLCQTRHKTRYVNEVDNRYVKCIARTDKA